MNLHQINRPVDEKGDFLDPVLPTDMTQRGLNDDELGVLYTQFCAMAQWVGFQYAVTSRVRAHLEVEYKRVRSRAFLAKLGNREEKAAKADTDPQVMRAENDLIAAQDVEGLTYPVLNAFLIGKEATSREITRRSGTDWNRSNMGGSSIPRVPSTASPTSVGWRGGTR
jgi:hypothetical protein